MINFSKKNELSGFLIKHILIGGIIGYFTLHPITMMIYYLDSHDNNVSFELLINEITQRFLHAFSLHMLSMGFIFFFIGSVIGLSYGYYTRTIKEKNIILEENEQKLKMQILLINKHASLGVIASSIGHEINNVLLSIVGYSELLKMEKGISDRFEKDIEKIIKSSSELRELSNTLLTLGKPSPAKTKKIELSKVIDNVTETLITCGVLKRVEIEKKYSENIEIVCDPFMLEQAIRNIEINASHAMDGQGKLILETGIYNKDMAYLRIKDSGPGIPEEYIEKIFEPFFTTKEESKGTGLGLNIVKQIINGLGGQISAINRNQGGAEFELNIPLISNFKT